MDKLPPVADWRCAECYSGLRDASRAGFAWEWLRRKRAYREACLTRLTTDGSERAARRFGLHRLEPYEIGVPAARPIWRAEADPYVLSAMAQPCAMERDEAFDVRLVSAIGTCYRGREGQEHWLFSDGLHHIRLDLATGSLTFGPAELDYRISGLARALPQLVTLSRLIAMARSGRIPKPLFKQERRASRWALILRTADALAAGASQREVAEQLLGLESVSRWRLVNPSLRRRAQRLVEAAKRAMEADPRLWLTGHFP